MRGMTLSAVVLAMLAAAGPSFAGMTTDADGNKRLEIDTGAGTSGSVTLTKK